MKLKEYVILIIFRIPDGQSFFNWVDHHYYNPTNMFFIFNYYAERFL